MPSGEIDVVRTLGAERLPQVLALYGSAWWTARRTPADVERMLAGTDVVLGLVERSTDQLVGFARALTDSVYLAVILDVIVASSHRGQGLGRRLMDELLAHAPLNAVDSVEVVCQPELVPFYRRWGFTDQVGRSLLMRRTSNPLLVRSTPPDL